MEIDEIEEGYFYHIYNRGNNSEKIFFSEENYAYFLKLLTKYIFPVADIYAYCLLNNHFHILVRIKEKNEIEIKYIRKENGGKHSAINMAILMSEGDYCLIIDSDDYLKYDAIEVISRHLKNIPSNLSGACFRCQDINGELIGDNADFPNNSTLWVKSNPASFGFALLGDTTSLTLINLNLFIIYCIYVRVVQRLISRV